MYAIISTGGKQYRVSEGDKVRVERLEGEVGEEVVFDRVLFVGADSEGSEGTDAEGSDGTIVSGTIVDQGKASKVVIFKFKRRKMYRRKRGHRQQFTEVEINQIGSPSSKKSKRAAAGKSETKAAKPQKREAKAEAEADAAVEPEKEKSTKATASSTKKKSATSTRSKEKTEAEGQEKQTDKEAEE